MSDKRRLTVSLSEHVLIDLEKMAKEKGLSKSALITMWVEEKKRGRK